MNLIELEFNDDYVEVIDNYVSVRKICENLGLVNISRQFQKIQSDETYQSKFIDIKINGITQTIFCIPYDKLNGWLFSVNQNKITNPKVKQNLIEYKNECFEVLHKHFNKSTPPIQLDLITPYEVRRDLATARRLLTIEKQKHRETAEFYENRLKVISPKDRYEDIIFKMGEILKDYECNELSIMQFYINQNKHFAALVREYRHVLETGDQKYLFEHMNKLIDERKLSDERYYALKDKISKYQTKMKDMSDLTDML